MNPIIHFKHLFAVAASIILLASCSAPKDLIFANLDWHISGHYGQIIDKDTIYRMTFGNVLIPDPLVIVSSADSVSKYPGMDRFITDILHTADLDNAEILFYAPEMHTMFVKPDVESAYKRPSSISARMSDEHPFTLFINEDDVENWNRKATEMYTYTYLDKRKNLLLIVDHYDYGETPIAQLTILQAENKTTKRMKVPVSLWNAFYTVHDLRKLNRDIEFWANKVEARRERAFANYKIGQEQKLRPGKMQ